MHREKKVTGLGEKKPLSDSLLRRTVTWLSAQDGTPGHGARSSHHTKQSSDSGHQLGVRQLNSDATSLGRPLTQSHLRARGQCRASVLLTNSNKQEFLVSPSSESTVHWQSSQNTGKQFPY